MMEYTEQNLTRILGENDGVLPQEIVEDLKLRVRENGVTRALWKITFPAVEIDGRVKMLNLSTLQYAFLSPETEEIYRENEAKRKEWESWNSSEKKAERKKRNDEFWGRYKTRMKVITLRQWQKESGDSRLEELWEIEKEGRQFYALMMGLEGKDFDGADIEIAGAEVVLDRIEQNYPDLHERFKRSMGWLDRFE